MPELIQFRCDVCKGEFYTRQNWTKCLNCKMFQEFHYEKLDFFTTHLLMKKILEISTNAPNDTWRDVPTDLSINVDHYLYGAPKVEQRKGSDHSPMDEFASFQSKEDCVYTL